MQLYANKMDNLEEMNKFLEKHLLSLKQEEIENMNRPITRIEIETVIKTKSSNKKKPRARWIQRRILSNI